MDRNQDAVISIDEFVLAYVDAENAIKTRIRDLDRNMYESNKMKQENERKM